ncbi:flagellar protein FlaG [uncultured Paraglaciecola sp.]|uniref:flagellar protein FlaG n=1 Tax=uncultured Paraglaciecola sp. TaxID=1765024 RepID=UPI0026195EA3|nr:flagellar protein FlaG [uncultured Paraglaciecola sp.]
MEINTSQVAQSFVQPQVEPTSDLGRVKDASENEVSTKQQQAKDFSTVADIEIQKQASFDINVEQIDSAISQISEFVQSNNRQLNFSVDEGSNKQVVRVTDASSGEVIRQIPSEEVLKLSERLKELQTDVGNAVGLLFNKQV